MITKKELKTHLKTNVGKIKFHKKDKTIREMMCTLSEKFLPGVDWTKKIKNNKTENEEVISVWDMDKNAWRSFSLNSIVEYSFEKI